MQPPSSRPDIFVFGSTKKQASSHTALGMMCTPASPTLACRINHTIKKVRRKNKKPRKFNTYALRQQELKMKMHQRARRKEENWKTRQKLKQSIAAVTPMTNTWLTRKYLGRVRKRKKPKRNNIRRGIKYGSDTPGHGSEIWRQNLEQSIEEYHK